jgi:hypothetical protein
MRSLLLHNTHTGKGKWFKGTIRYAHRDGTYDIKYADGDTEQGVLPKFIRRLGTDKTNSSSSPKKSSAQPLDSETEAVLFEAGDEVEARFGGRARFFKGTRAQNCVVSYCERCCELYCMLVQLCSKYTA